LKRVRERLGLSVREVQEASARIAEGENDADFYISASRLSQIENEGSLPGVSKIFSLSAIYGIDFISLVGNYGVNPDRAHRYREALRLPATHPIPVDAHSLETTARFPVRLDPSFRWETTQLLNRVVALWGELPAVLLQQLNPRRNAYAYIGMQDYTMYPLLRPGSVVMIDTHRRRILRGGWISEFERPIYFVELRESYRCAWCQMNGARVTLVPHPMSNALLESFPYPGEAEIVGQVVGVAMRLVPAPLEAENEGAPAAQSASER
jgi:transcriptional regulator with XRE-family HTH domain